MKIWAFISTTLALVFMVLYLRIVLDARTGGGQYEYSPDEKFIASADSLVGGNPLSLGSTNVYCEFKVGTNHTSSLVRIVVSPINTADDMYFRELPKIINWATNSDEVTFSIPGIFLRLNVTNSP